MLTEKKYLFPLFCFFLIKAAVCKTEYSVRPDSLVSLTEKINSTSWYSFAKPGYLYNPLYNTFLGVNREKKDKKGRYLLSTFDNPSKATRFQIIKVTDPKTEKVGVVIASLEDPADPKKSKGNLKNMVIQVVNGNVFGVGNFTFSASELVAIIPEIGGDLPLFVIYIRRNCLSASYRKIKVLYEAHYSRTNKFYRKQLWMWIDEDRFKKDVVNNTKPDYEKIDRENKEQMKKIIEHYENSLTKEEEEENQENQEIPQRVFQTIPNSRYHSSFPDLRVWKKDRMEFGMFKGSMGGFRDPAYSLMNSAANKLNLEKLFSDSNNLNAIGSSNYGKNPDLVFGQSQQCSGSVMIGYCV